MSEQRLREALDLLRQKFTSGNDVPVERAVITRAEYEAISSCLTDREAPKYSWEYRGGAIFDSSKGFDMYVIDQEFEDWWRESGFEPHASKPIAREAWLASKDRFIRVGCVVDAFSDLRAISIEAMPKAGTVIYSINESNK